MHPDNQPVPDGVCLLVGRLVLAYEKALHEASSHSSLVLHMRQQLQEEQRKSSELQRKLDEATRKIE